MKLRRRSGLLSGARPEKVLGKEHRDRPAWIFRTDPGVLERPVARFYVAQEIVADAEGVEHRHGRRPDAREAAVADIAGVVDDEKQRQREVNAGGDEAVAAVEQPGVLHPQRRLLSRSEERRGGEEC